MTIKVHDGGKDDRFVDVYLDHLFIGTMSFRKWDNPEKAISAACRRFGTIADAADRDEISGVECDEDNQVVRITTTDND